MFRPVQEASYFPTIKWKQGERDALASMGAGNRKLLVPIIIVPAAGEFDPEKKRALSASEHIKSFGPRLAASWGQRPAFIDAVLVDDAEHAEGLAGC